MDAIFFVLRTGCQWNALNVTGICSSSSAHRRFQEWVAAEVFAKLWILGLAEYDALEGWIGPGCRWTGRSPRPRWGARRPGRTRPTAASGG